MDVEDDEEEAKVESKAAGPKSESVATSASSVATGGPSGSATGLAPSAQAWTIAMDTPSGPDATAVTQSDSSATSGASQTRVQTSEAARSASGEAASSLAVAGSLPPRKATVGGAGVGANPRKLAIHDLALDEEDTRAAELAAALEQGRSLFGDSVAKLGSEVWQERRDALDTLCVQLQGLSQRRAAGDASASEVDVNVRASPPRSPPSPLPCLLRRCCSMSRATCCTSHSRTRWAPCTLRAFACRCRRQPVSPLPTEPAPLCMRCWTSI